MGRETSKEHVKARADVPEALFPHLRLELCGELREIRIATILVIDIVLELLNEARQFRGALPAALRIAVDILDRAPRMLGARPCRPWLRPVWARTKTARVMRSVPTLCGRIPRADAARAPGPTPKPTIVDPPPSCCAWPSANARTTRSKERSEWATALRPAAAARKRAANGGETRSLSRRTAPPTERGSPGSLGNRCEDLIVAGQGAGPPSARLCLLGGGTRADKDRRRRLCSGKRGSPMGLSRLQSGRQERTVHRPQCGSAIHPDAGGKRAVSEHCGRCLRELLVPSFEGCVSVSRPYLRDSADGQREKTRMHRGESNDKCSGSILTSAGEEVKADRFPPSYPPKLSEK